MKVDVIIPTYNGVRYIEDALLSVINQTYSNVFITVIDDGSTDGTIKKVEQMLKMYPGKIQFIKSKTNPGAVNSRIEAISVTDGEVIFFLDQDDMWHEDKIIRQVYFFKKGVDIVHTNISFINEDGELIQKDDIKENDCRNKIFSTQIKPRYFVLVNPIRLTSSAIRRDFYNKIGGFEVFFGGEDWFFWLKSYINGASFKLIQEQLTLRRIHSENTSEVYRKERFNGFIKAINKAKRRYPEIKKLLYLRKFLIYLRLLKYNFIFLIKKQ
jgi:glycosyltransferase involved in cell wall biosynthesis